MKTVSGKVVAIAGAPSGMGRMLARVRDILADEPRILIGNDARMIDAMAHLAPRRYGPIVTRSAKAAARRAT